MRQVGVVKAARIATFGALGDWCGFVCGRDGEGQLCLKAAVIVSPAGAPRVDGSGFCLLVVGS
jgi:hypothetical protein